MTDQIAMLKEFDKQDMASWTRKFIDDLETAFQHDLGILDDDDWHGILCIGMGGSGAGGELLSTLADNYAGLPIVNWRDYGLPSWWGPEWLVIATSYSGNTEETLDGATLALEKGGTVIGISSGGRLESLLDSNEEGHHINVPAGQMPRSAFGHLFGTQLSLMWTLGIFPAPTDEDLGLMINRLRDATRLWDPQQGSTLALKAAELLSGSDIGVVSSSNLGCVSQRFVNQLNENSNVFGRSSVMPEMSHNEIIPWTDEHPGRRTLVLIKSDLAELGNKKRIEWFEEKSIFTHKLVIEAVGSSLVEHLLYVAHVSDWISIMLAVSNGVDPSDMDAIPELKEFLKEGQ